MGSPRTLPELPKSPRAPPEPRQSLVGFPVASPGLDLGQGRIWVSLGKVASSQVTLIAARSVFGELTTGATGAMGTTGAGEVVARSAARTSPSTHFHTDRGQDDGSLHKLRQK